MTADDARLKELRRIAFGRTHSPEDEARATAAREELATLLAAPVAEPVEASTPVADVVEARAAVAEPAEAPAKPQRTRRPTWLVPAAIALLVGVLLGAGSMIATGGNVAATAPSPTFTPGSSGLPSSVNPLEASVALEPGSVGGADRWLEREQRPEDRFAGNDYLFDFYHLNPDSTRLAVSSPHGKIWVATTADGQYCLFTETSNQSGGECVTPEVLQESGITLLGDSNLLAAWNGDRISMSTTRP
jgi:hypothetical protein